MAVPPLARTADGQFDDSANGAVIRHLEAGGVTTLLYGGNALAQHWPMSVYADWLDRLEALAAPESWVLPSVGPDAGKLVDQAAILKSRRFPVALMLPMGAPLTHAGMADAMRRFTAESGVQLLVYIKTDNYIPAQTLAALVAEGVVFGVKYAVPRDLGAPDPYLSDIINAIGTERIISGFGEPPAIPHMLDFGLPGFTAGCVCIAPALSNALFQALKQGDKARAEQLLLPIQPLEALRGQVNEIRVLHEAVALSGLAETGPILLPSSPVPEDRRAVIAAAAQALRAAEADFRAALAA
ncbi:MAG: dihydrodipicolinate synthase family protein [Pseudotabrizicola sp.]|nr:dihydrodipicolinate synthase family protein [Pseudotabrizicola sp.]MDZ7575310.1 dihydrodipicolinate synthase family protein [Pseudotabrizicola sp.]